ncbi:Glutamate-cysteine ligase family 2(GCS2) [Streptoalloteichus tenebrarius]|uniref:Glutamate-cysteine ligase family 2(GCS2) n=1 Tax=Streptoalloteichus tenebrarius (strain ATCC 17920 / DSM 40477 / JCM 4838 / CBS 697.72 / NBRC 16177 / NCIMB 11028 / NRRL B-12390 / A12253. 1 / ISP 5477) TaxID=1933 RepID=A0ABT1HVT9_STRSD|nr:glutamate-cysteine ligase family protein [Streptoalloteichus tenebrarius]MCP2259535.1 Glutamate-cysteine ligase family 2(GCS2) [Streptoalloteichus tenebrarius]
MGRDVSERKFSREDRQRYREKVQRCLDALARMLANDAFHFPRQQMGLEIELNLVDEVLRPAMANTVVLEKISDPCFQTELGQHNIEINVPPRPLAGDEALELERDLRDSLNSANAKARDAGAALVMIGMLPTLRREHFDPHWLSVGPRYTMLNRQIFASRGEEIVLEVDGVPMPGRPKEKLRCFSESILPEASCTSVQCHIQVAPKDFAAHWNAAQCLAGVQVALAGNSPFLLGRALWHETRIPIFEQATDTRPQELKNQGVRPRVWFGERWITSIFDLFEENVRYFPALLPESESEDPLEALEDGRAPQLSELRLHNGTVWRWNRPVYDLVDGVPHLRVENRVLPAGPTVVDTIANAAFFYGAQRALCDQERPLWTQMSFQAAEENLYAGAKHGLDAQLYWPGIGWVPPDELVLRRLLPMAHEGLRACGVSDAARERYLGLIEQRCVARRTGSVWQRETVSLLESRGMDREAALAAMLHRYVEHMHAGEPVHNWPVA